jgi:hypothetical protein
MLYTHALESMFAFVNLKELSNLMTVCRNWYSAVLTMRPLKFSLFLKRHGLLILRLLISSLRRHIVSIGLPSISTGYLKLSSRMFSIVQQIMTHRKYVHIQLQDITTHFIFSQSSTSAFAAI